MFRLAFAVWVTTVVSMIVVPPSRMGRGNPMGRPGQSSDIANAALFLASPYADFVTGEVLSVDGGSGTGRTWLPFSRATAR